MSRLFQTFVDAAPFSWIAAGMGVALTSLLLAVLLRARLARPQRWLAFPVLCSLALLTAAAVAIASVEVGRRDVAAQLGMREAFVSADSVVIARGIARQLTGLVLLGPVALASLASAGLLRWALRRRPAVPTSRATIVLGATLVLPLIIGALGASIYGLRVHSAFHAQWDPISWEPAVFHRLQQTRHLLTLLRAGIVASAGAGLIAAVVWARSAGTRPLGRSRVATASAIFAAGLGAFVSTRGRAAERPLPILTSNQRDDLSHFGIVYSQEMPRFSRCQPLSDPAPMLEFSGKDVLFDRVQVSPEEFRDKLDTYRRLFPLLHPGKTVPPSTLLVLADVVTPIDRTIPYLLYADLLYPGKVEIVMVGSNPLSFASKTLGLIERHEFCSRVFSLREDAVPLSRYRTWRDLAEAVDRSAAVLRISAQ